MKTEKQPLLAKQTLLKVTAPIILPLVLSCASKNAVRQLDEKLTSQEELNQSQTDGIVGLNGKTQAHDETLKNLGDSLTDFTKLTQAAIKNQNERIDLLATGNKTQAEDIKQLQSAVRLLQDFNANSSVDQSRAIETDEILTLGEQNIDLAWEKTILGLLVEYRQTLPLLNNFETSLDLMNDAVKRRNILKKVLTEGTALTHSHITGKTTRVSIPREKTFDFAEVLKEIDELNPNQKILMIDNIINKQQQKIDQWKIQPSTSQLSRAVPRSTVLLQRPTEDRQVIIVPPTESQPDGLRIEIPCDEQVTPKTDSIRLLEYTPLAETPSDQELVPLQEIETGVNLYKRYVFDLNALPSENTSYAYVVYGVRGIIQGSKKVSFRNDIVVIKSQRCNSHLEVRLGNGAIVLYDLSQDPDGTKIERTIQSLLNEHSDLYGWPHKTVNQVRMITIQKK